MPSTDFTVTREVVRGTDALVVTDGTVEVALAERGGTLLLWRAPVAGSVIDLVDGYADVGELDRQDGVRNGLMVPFSNRVADARYTFEGRSHDLLPDVPDDADRTFYHGWVRYLPLRVEAVDAAGDSARIVLGGSIRPDDFVGYPFALDVRLEWTFTRDGLELVITGANVGEGPAPYAAGWHPYFRLDTSPVDDLELTIPAATVIRTDDLIPLDGAAAFAPIGDEPDLDFSTPRPVAGRVLDVCFADLAADGDGWISTVLRNPATGAGIRVRQERGLMHVFTGDTLTRDRRASIALEPVEVMTNAFNRPDCRDAITLPAGAERTFRCAVEILRG
jgi:aldose 1-epimerase